MMNRRYILTLLLMLLVEGVQAQKRPNIVVILADDMGFSDVGSYGGEVRTPNIDRLAGKGIRYKQFYNAARCCPTRAALMTGLYPHQAGMGWMAAADLGTPAYAGNLNRQSVTIAEVLKTAGYATCMTGKWHLTNERKIDGMVKDNWPCQRGFDRYFGVIPGAANYFTPQVYSNNDRYQAPRDFYLTDAISDTSVRYIAEHFRQPTAAPLFMYVAYTSPHWPLQAPQKVIDTYKANYRKGWDKLREERFARQKKLGLFPANAVMSKRDATVPAWDSLTQEEQEQMALRMAIYAAQIDIMDQGIGRIVKQLEANGQLDNTLIFFLSDNGACAEFISSGESKALTGAANTWESYHTEWANVSSTPFKEYKHYTYEGGIATPLIVHWPAGVSKKLNNQWIGQYGFLSDIMATCVDVAGAQYPDRFRGNNIVPLEGKSLRPHFSATDNSRGVIFWEHEANIAVRDGKWKLVATTAQDRALSVETLALYDMAADPTELNDLASREPARVKQLFAAWQAWANKVGALPLDTREYGLRAREYRKQVNGGFDDLLGGWQVTAHEPIGMIAVDSSARISGKNSVRVVVHEAAIKPAALSMAWRFFARKGERYRLKLKTTSAASASFFLRVAYAEKPELKLLNETLTAGPSIQTLSTEAFEATEDGPLQIGLYFGTMPRGTEVWIDDVELAPL